MIRTIDELIAFTEEFGKAEPDLADEIVLTKPGCPKKELNKIAESLPGIPASFLDLLGQVRLCDRSIGYFQFPESKMAQSLIEMNDPEDDFANRMGQEGAYNVASWEADPIGLIYRDGTFAAGNVVLFNDGDPSAAPRHLAESFEQMLLLAGNLDSIRARFQDLDDPPAAMREFDACLRTLVPATQPNILATWKMISEVVLG